MDNKPIRRDYSQTDLDNARTKGQIVGWIQGGIATFAILLALRLLGWLPTLIVVAVVGFLGVKLLTRQKQP